MQEAERKALPERSPGEAPRAHVHALSAFFVRDFRFLWAGAFVSNVGTWIHNTALFWVVKERTGSDAWVGLVNLAQFLPVFLLVLVAGSLADTLDRKKMILYTQTAMMLGALALAVLFSLGQCTLPAILGITAFMGIAFVFNFPAWRAIVTDLVPPDIILNAVALDAAQFNMARFLGPMLGALVLALWGATPAFYLNALSFMAVIAALLAIKTRTPPVSREGSGLCRHIGEMMAFAWKNPWARNLLAVMGVSSLFGLTYLVLLPGVAKDVLRGGSTAYGILLGATGLGAGVSAPLVTALNRRFREVTIIRWAALAGALALVAFALSRSLPLSASISFLLGASFLMLSSSINAVLQSGVERNMRGRIMSLYILAFQGLYPLGGLLMGFVSDRTSPTDALLLGGTVCLFMGLMLFLFPDILEWSDLTGA